MIRGTVLLISGSRDLKKVEDENFIRDTIFEFSDDLPHQCIILHGGCPTGADDFAHNIGKRYDIPPISLPADWGKYKKVRREYAAGPIRNGELVDLALTFKQLRFNIIVLAFPTSNSKGTRDLIKKAKQDNLEVHVFEMD